MRNKKFLQELLEATSPSSYEINATEVITKFIKDHNLEVNYSDKIGNTGCSLGHGDTKILLSGHMDEIAMAVQYIDKDGFITPTNLAGIDPKVLPGSQVIILGEKGQIPGIIHKHPLHLEYREEIKDKVQKEDYFRIDIGAESDSEVFDSGIYPGSLIVFSRNINLGHGKNRLHGNALDDKAGVYVVFQVLDLLLRNNGSWMDKYTVYFIAGVQEESGLRGLKIAAHNIDPDISIDLDVTFACDGGFVNKNKYGEILLGHGAVIEYGQDKSRRIAEILKSIAKEESIPYQLGVSRCGGTNTTAIQLSSSDCETMLISLPNCNMHSQNEVCDWRDLGSAEKLIYNAIIQELL